jgi:putative transcriptional regulator
MSVGDELIQGLNEAIEWADGKRELRTTRIKPLKRYSPEQIKAIRRKAKLSQSLFGGLIGVSTKSVSAWESGKRVPTGSASRLIELIESRDKQLLGMCN